MYQNGGMRKRPQTRPGAPKPMSMDREPAMERPEDFWGELTYALAQLQHLGWRDMRPWGEFFEQFKPPNRWTTQMLDDRITTNFLQFRGNYFIIIVGLVLSTIAASPLLLLALVGCGVLWVVMFPTQEHRTVEVGGRELSRPERYLLAGAAVLVALSLSGAVYRVILALAVGCLVCMVHAVFRPRSVASKANRLREDMKANTGLDLDDIKRNIKHHLDDIGEKTGVNLEGIAQALGAKKER